jgi:hypothetical protein
VSREVEGASEPVPAPVVFVGGVAAATVTKGMMHLMCFIDQPTPEGVVERLINLRVVMPLAAYATIRKAIDLAIADESTVERRPGMLS